MACTDSNKSGERELKMSCTVPNINLSSVCNHPYDIYAGCVTGYLKGCSLSSRSHYNLNELESANPSSEIKCMSWKNHNEAEILTGQRDNSIIHYSLTHRKSSLVPMDLPNEPGIIRSVRSHDHLIISAFSKGLIKCVNVDMVDAASDDAKAYENIDAGSDLFCMDHNKYIPSLVLSGGKENPLKIWDISTPNTPVFTSKNVKNDWLNLTVPVWVTKAEFFSESKKVVTGTARADVRLYDPTSAQRRPVIDIDTKEKSPITALAMRPNSDYQAFVGTGKGSLFLVDLRKKSVVRNYKGIKGGVTDIKFHPSLPFFATSSIDRHIYCFNPDAPKQAKCSSVYAVSQINCILFSSLWSPDDKVVQDASKSSVQDNINEKRKESSVLNGSDDEEDEGLWESMNVVKTKRKSSSVSETVKKRKRKT
ncbi:WD repeat-containing protein 74 [Elysia marginata]|uniref:WD repeat-containing protein 74 n=1 Tax=Elysia marginata TaxID=1093978 RepID=A0AAV4HMN9_9GAST|nr:WD repeat-containing protein 74 [Elysia marginata]